MSVAPTSPKRRSPTCLGLRTRSALLINSSFVIPELYQCQGETRMVLSAAHGDPAVALVYTSLSNMSWLRVLVAGSLCSSLTAPAGARAARARNRGTSRAAPRPRLPVTADLIPDRPV